MLCLIVLNCILTGLSLMLYRVNLYGAPENAAFSLNNMVSGAIASIKTLGGMNYKDVYNNFPDKGYVGACADK